MVSSTLLISSLAAAAALLPSATHAKALLDALPEFLVPSVDYNELSTAATPALANELLAALHKDGVVALRNVPRFAELREQYLTKAAECVFTTMDADYVTHKAFDDGTQRHTLSGSVATACPGYQEAYEQFSQLVTQAVAGIGGALDATEFTVADGGQPVTARALVDGAVHLDHFHLYEAAQIKAEDMVKDMTLSLPLHEDNGLFVTVVAPKFFDVADDNTLVPQASSDNNCFMLETGDGRRVRPVIREDELVIMMGTGATQWLETSHLLPAVMHGMKMPPVALGDRPVVRAWFGKMTLLPAMHQTTSQAPVHAARCAAGRHLEASATCDATDAASCWMMCVADEPALNRQTPWLGLVANATLSDPMAATALPPQHEAGVTVVELAMVLLAAVGAAHLLAAK